ncbi:alpha/beta fold hydrolase [Pedobacter sp. SAFR-022]|uniref:alpha/beta fold hydrolase n=1 Tax=Pedobacter sp. SAFR-022 TaxID=3436861 RepID=UPI003F7F68F5
MKTYKQRLQEVRKTEDPQALMKALWNYISFPIRLPNRPHQEELMAKASRFSMSLEDPYFAMKALSFQGYSWGEGSRKIYLTHGWSSKAADFAEIITALLQLENVQIIAFDALGNGNSEGELSNLMLYVKPLEAIIEKYGMLEVLIGHSLGAMANVVALKSYEAQPKLLISITPVIELGDNFTGMMNHAGVNPVDQLRWFQDFHDYYKLPVSYFDMKSLYAELPATKHLVFYDEQDEMLPYAQLKLFLQQHPELETRAFNAAGHYRILREPGFIEVLSQAIAGSL